MGPVTAAGRPAGMRTRQQRRCVATAPGGRTSVGTALVPVTPIEPADMPRGLLPRPAAPFLAQVIAASHQLPQAREKRRVEPREAIAAYRAAARNG